MHSRLKTFFAAAAVFLAAAAQQAPAQTIESAGKAFDRFVTLYTGGLRGDELYNALLDACNENMSLGTGAASSADEMEARNNLIKLWPYLRNAAAHYSQSGDSRKALTFAKAYVDIPLMGIFDDVHIEKDDQYPTLVYFAASGSYNSRDFRSAVKYFKEYLGTNTQSHRRDVFYFMAQACSEIKDYALAQKYLDQAVREYPSDYDLLSKAINASIDSEDNAKLEDYLNRALEIKPNEPQLLFLQGKNYEEMGEFQKAISPFKAYRSIKPNSLDGARHLAANYYNVGALNINKSMGSTDASTVSRYAATAKDYFEAAIPILQNVVANDPANTKFIQALAIAYNYSGRNEEFAAINDRLASSGAGRVSREALPEVIVMSGKKAVGSGSSGLATTLNLNNTDEGGTPAFTDFAKTYVGSLVQQWQAKDPYETVREYQDRVNTSTREAKVKEFMKEAEKSYIEKYSTKLHLSDLHLRPYDAENEVFLAESKYGEVIIPVPRANNEARLFETSWNGIRLSDDEYCMNGDKVAIKSLSFTTPSGKTYRYDNASALNYTVTNVDMDFEDIDYDSLAGADGLRKVNRNVQLVGKSDVDRDIPETSVRNPNAFAFIIANEDYQMVAKVPMALNDGKTVAQYFNKTLGLPENNVRVFENATFGIMMRAVNEIKQISSAYNGDIDIFFYYAGHGIPNESTKDGYLLPVDSDGLSTDASYQLSRLYKDLGSLDARKVVVLLDACFSGANRDGQMLASARGVALKAKQESPQGNMIAFCAAHDDETAFPYDEKGHGMFTYFLLKKLQETAGNVTLKELSDYVIENVRRQSIVVNHKPQTPVISSSISMEGHWERMKLIPPQQEQ